MTDQQRISRLLYDTLEEIGVSEDVRLVHQQTADIIEILVNIAATECILSENISALVHICGSRYEGSLTPDLESDMDIIFCNLSLPVVLDPANIPDDPPFLMIRDDWTYPGYVKLQVVDNGRPLTKYDRRQEGTSYDVMGRMCEEHFMGDNMHGPADMHIALDGQHYYDFIHAYKCANIPEWANEWISRPRHHGWPTAEQLDTMSKMGCMVVPVGHWESHEQELEWRLSFSLQERMLMSSLNTVQHKVYIVLKMIKKQVLERRIKGESLSSYHLKTAILHAVEGTSADFWTPENLINCIMYCLRLLLQWTEIGVCPNYFIKDQNLFSKESFRRVKDQLKTELKQMVRDNHHVVYLLHYDCISSVMRDGDTGRMQSIIYTRRKEYIYKLKRQIIDTTIKSCWFSILHTCQDLPTTLTILVYRQYQWSSIL